MYRSIMVPLDGSKFGEEAVAVAAGLARRGAETIHLVMVLESTGPSVPGRRSDSGGHNARKEVEAAAQAYLNQVSERITESTDSVDVTITVLPPGDPASALADHVFATRAGLVVMASHGRGPLSRLWLGSTTDRLLRDCPRPILVIRPTEDVPTEMWDDPLPVRRVLLPLDGSREAEKVLPGVLSLVGDGARITLLHVLSPYVPGAYPYLPRVEGQEEKRARGHEEARRYLEEKAEELRRQGFDVKVRTPLATHPAQAILEEATQGGDDLIAIATVRKSEGLRGTLGSVADKVVRGADCPVLIARRADDDTPAG